MPLDAPVMTANWLAMVVLRYGMAGKTAGGIPRSHLFRLSIEGLDASSVRDWDVADRRKVSYIDLIAGACGAATT